MNNSFVSKDVAVEVAVVFAKAPFYQIQDGDDFEAVPQFNASTPASLPSTSSPNRNQASPYKIQIW